MSETKPINTVMRDYEAITGTSNSGFVADFSSPDLQRLSENIADNINTIIHGTKALAKSMNLISGPKDSIELRDMILDIQKTVKDSILAGTGDLKLLRIAVRCGNKLEELHELRLKQDFRDVSAQFSSVQKKISKKMSKHLLKVGEPCKDHFQEMERQAIEDDQNARLIALQTQGSISENMKRLLDKEACIRKMEAIALEISQTINYFSARVQSQTILVDSIDGHVEVARDHVEAGEDHLSKAAAYKRKYRMKMCMLIIIVLIITVICVVLIFA